METIYYSEKTGDGAGPKTVFKDRFKKTKLPLRTDLVNHSPSGFSWGYRGSGPAQLALAVLADATDDETALEHYQQYKADYIASISPESQFRTTKTKVREWVDEQ